MSSGATFRYWVARCRRGTPPMAGSPCAALLWASDELERMRRTAQHIIDNHPDPAACAAAQRILNERTP